MPRTPPKPPIPASFISKKAQILSLLTRSEEVYADNSPKGSVDAQIRDLIEEINAYDGLVTTSSCAGRVAVFVEGPKVTGSNPLAISTGDGPEEVEGGDETRGGGASGSSLDMKRLAAPTAITATSPGGKGGGRWLYVSHEPILLSTGRVQSQPETESTNGEDESQQGVFSKLFNLAVPSETPRPPPSSPAPSAGLSSNPRLIHLSFSPLILHIHCATLQHARPVLAAAINAGFRESGVQSLRIMDDPENGVMVAVRTAGLGFETVVGIVATDWAGDAGEGEGEIMQRVVSEEYLATCASVVNERFRWNVERRERFRRELRRAMDREGLEGGSKGHDGWEDKDERRRRKREEGLERQRRHQDTFAKQHTGTQAVDEDLSTLETT